MGAFDDELRASLRDRAARVPTPADLLPGIERRARRLRRRRLGAGGAAAVVLAAGVAAGAPYLMTDHVSDDKPPPVAAAAPQMDRPELAPLPSRPPPEISGAAGNQLPWPSRGYRPPPSFSDGVEKWYARQVDDPLRRHTLWSGPLPRDRWAVFEQYWSPNTDTGMWTTVLLVGGRDGGGVHAPYQRVTTFNHQRPRESASLSGPEVDRIAGYAFGFQDFVLVVGSPEAARAAVTLDGETVRREPLDAGAAMFHPVRRGPVELFQLRDEHDELLTPNDYRGAQHRDAAIRGWGFDRR